MTLYKALDLNGVTFQVHAKWLLPERGAPGAWMPPITGRLAMARNGYHLAKESDLLRWFGQRIFEAEYRGEKKGWIGKVAVRQARLVRECSGWNAGTAVLFAADCAERVLPLFEAQRPGDDRPRKAIAAARAPAERPGTEAARVEGWSGALSAAAEAAGMTDGALTELLLRGLKQAGDRHSVPRRYIGWPGAAPRMTQTSYGRHEALGVAQILAKKQAPGNAALAAALAAASACNLKCAYRAVLWSSAWAQVAAVEGGRSRAGRWAVFGPLRGWSAGTDEELWQNQRLLYYVKGQYVAPAQACPAMEPAILAETRTANVLPFVPRRKTGDA